jgi:hypothetical protein
VVPSYYIQRWIKIVLLRDSSPRYFGLGFFLLSALYKAQISSRLSAVEADGCQVSRPLCGLQWLHSDCLHVQHEDVGESSGETAMGCVARIWEEDDSMLSCA